MGRLLTVLVPEEAAIVRLIFSLADDHGMSALGIARELEERGIAARYRRRWHEAQVGRVLSDRCYKGEWVVWPAKDGEQEVLATNPPESLIDAATWERVQASKEAWREHRRPRVKREFLLSGMVVCGYCGGHMAVRHPDERNRYYGCNRAVRTRKDHCPARRATAHELNALAWGEAMGLVRNPRAIRAAGARPDRI